MRSEQKGQVARARVASQRFLTWLRLMVSLALFADTAILPQAFIVGPFPTFVTSGAREQYSC